MKEGAITSFGRPVLSHMVTALLTLALAVIVFGDRLGSRRLPPLAQIPGRARSQAPPCPEPLAPSSPACGRAECSGSGPAATGRRAQGPRPRRAEQRSGLRRGEQERRQHHHRGRGVRLLRRRDFDRHRLGIRHRQARPYPDQFSRRPGKRREPSLDPGQAVRRLGARGQDHRRRCDQRRGRAVDPGAARQARFRSSSAILRR